MPSLSLLEIDLIRLPWETWTVPVIGVLTAGLTLFAGRAVLRRLRPAASRTALLAEHDPFLQGSTSERRVASRRKGNHVEILVTDAAAVAEPTRGWVVDRSMSGLCLLLNQAVAEGGVISIRPRQGPAGTPWVRVDVRTCSESKGVYEIGCQFQRTPPWSVMLLFG